MSEFVKPATCVGDGCNNANSVVVLYPNKKDDPVLPLCYKCNKKSGQAFAETHSEMVNEDSFQFEHKKWKSDHKLAADRHRHLDERPKDILALTNTLDAAGEHKIQDSEDHINSAV